MVREFDEYSDEGFHTGGTGTEVKDSDKHLITPEERDRLIREYNAERKQSELLKEPEEILRELEDEILCEFDNPELVKKTVDEFCHSGIENKLTIRVSAVNQSTTDIGFLTITYNSDTQIGFNFNKGVIVQYDCKSGHYTISNGSLEGLSGTLKLFDYEQISTDSIISSFAEEVIMVDKSETDVKYQIQGKWQYTTEYACRLTHIVDNQVRHTRNYDKDRHLLVRAKGGISDFVLLGCANISYVE